VSRVSFTALAALLALAAPRLARAEDAADADTEADDESPDVAPTKTSIGGFFQPQFRMRQNSPAPNDEDGFRFARVRPQIRSETTAGNLELSAKAEMEVQPSFTLIDFYGTVGRKLPDGGHISVDVGQVRTPISRQQLMADTVLSFVDKAQIATIAPAHDLGARLILTPPDVTWLKLYIGEFNGDGPNKIQNENESYLHTARLELTPIGESTLEESAFGKPFVTLAVSGGLDQTTIGDHHEKQQYIGADLSGSWMGISGSVELLNVHHHQPDGDPTTRGPDYNAYGWDAQIAYLLPSKLPPFRHGRAEIAFRVEEIDRNDKIPITTPGDPNQSQREYTACISYYLRKHVLKAQLAANHFIEVENHTATGADATYPNDQLVLQLTYRME
jgi:hypothetical protein